MSIYWGIILGWGETKFNCYLVDSQILRQLAGEMGEKLNGFHWGLIVGNFDLTGEEGFISAEGL